MVLFAGLLPFVVIEIIEGVVKSFVTHNECKYRQIIKKSAKL